MFPNSIWQQALNIVQCLMCEPCVYFRNILLNGWQTTFVQALSYTRNVSLHMNNCTYLLSKILHESQWNLENCLPWNLKKKNWTKYYCNWIPIIHIICSHFWTDQMLIVINVLLFTDNHSLVKRLKFGILVPNNCHSMEYIT